MAILGDVNIWGEGGLFEERLRQKMRLAEPQSPGPRSIIGGRFVDAGDTEGRNAAIAHRDEVDANVRAQRGMRAEFGSPDLMMDYERARPGSAAELGQKPLISSPSPGSEQGVLGESYRNVPGNDALTSILYGESGPRTPLRAAGNRVTPPQKSSSLFDDTSNGFRSGGVITKQRDMKHPGYQNSGKVELPGYCSGGRARKGKKRSMRGYAAGGKIGNVREDDGNDTVDVRVREGEYLLNPPTVAAFGGGDYSAGVRVLDGIVTATTGEKPGPTPVNAEGESVEEERMEEGVRPGFLTSGRVNEKTWLTPEEAVQNQRLQELAAQRNAARGANAGQPRVLYGTGPRDLSAVRNPTLRGAQNAAGTAVRGAVRAEQAVEAGARSALRGAARVAPTAMRWGTRGAIPLAAGLDAYDVYKVYQDNPEDVGTEIVDKGARWAGAAAGAIGGSQLGLMTGPAAPVAVPVLSATGAVLGYIGAGEGMEALRGSEAPSVQLGNRLAAEQRGQQTQAETPPADPNAYYRAFTNAPVDLRDIPTARTNAAVEPGGMNIVQRTGGPGNEVIVREDLVQPDGTVVPSFTNLRTTPFETGATALQQQADARAAEDYARREQRGQRMLTPGALATSGRMDEAIAMRQAELGAASKAGKTKQAEIDDIVKDRSRRPVYDDDGNITDHIEDVQWQQDFYDAMAAYSAANPNFDIYDLPRAELDQVLADVDRIRNETLMAIAAARAQGEVIDRTPRTGANSLRYIPGSSISIGDVWGPEATIGDYARGIFSNAPIDDGMVEDPISGARIPAARAARDYRYGGISRDALRRMGIPYTEKE